VSDPSEVDWTYNTVTTSATTADQTIVTRTIPAGKTFYLLSYSAGAINTGTAPPAPFKIWVGGTVFDAFGLSGGLTLGSGANTRWDVGLHVGLKFAVAGDVVKITVTPGSNNSTAWGAKIVGVLR
jgi:hypothetical protein